MILMWRNADPGENGGGNMGSRYQRHVSGSGPEGEAKKDSQPKLPFLNTTMVDATREKSSWRAPGRAGPRAYHTLYLWLRRIGSVAARIGGRLRRKVRPTAGGHEGSLRPRVS